MTVLLTQILTELKAIHQINLAGIGDYAFTDEACRLVGLKDPNDLMLLRQRFMKPGEFGKRGRYFVYKKAALKQYADKLDRGEIMI